MNIVYFNRIAKTEAELYAKARELMDSNPKLAAAYQKTASSQFDWRCYVGSKVESVCPHRLNGKATA